MNTETTMHADTRVSFTIELPPALAAQLTAQAKAADTTPEKLARRAVSRFIRIENRLNTRTIPENEDMRTAIREIIREELRKTAQPKPQTADKPAPNDAAAEELQKKLNMLIEERKVARRRLIDTEHSVHLTAKKIEEYDTEYKTLEKEQKSILDELTKFPDDRGLISRLDEIAANLFSAKYNRGLMAAQHQDAIRCCEDLKNTVQFIDTECITLETKLRNQEVGIQ